ncbi:MULTISPECIES: AAA family ATPase [Agrobacterium]|uniref:AAA family ATPase n=1 Tax=Agrobacterium tumefaciens TaxID=358 RepID=UPI001573D6A7|nr:ATP-binding protein [Agrobacterium tumefaciens]NSZ06317.1 ATP-binding protein [Agrobacterium tumefaciens]
MHYDIYPASRDYLSSIKGQVALQQDNWDDYNFKTTYQLYYRAVNATEPVLIGSVKILKLGQKGREPLQITEPFERLDEQWCSIGGTLDYYERLSTIGDGDRAEILASLRDVVANPSIIPEFQNELGWRRSLFRENGHWDRFLDDATAMLNKDFSKLANLDTPFSFRPTEVSDILDLDFSAPSVPNYYRQMRMLGPSRKEVLLPQRIVALIGRNGSGKSTLLSRLSHVAFASGSGRQREEVRKLGLFDPPDINFSRIITISYSAFDSFDVPGLDGRDRMQVAKDITLGQGRFAYCGLRDISAEAQERENTDDASATSKTITRLKSIDALATEFEQLVNVISNGGRRPVFLEALAPLLSEPSFAQRGDEGEAEFILNEPKRAFLSWSTGHKIALHVIASLTARSARKSLVLFDEPEMHLHPPLTAALMQAIRIILEEVDAFCIVATHSPVVVQETLARHVRIVTRAGDTVHFKQPRLETFGENVGILTYDIFGLVASSTDFHEVLDLLVGADLGLDVIENLFTPALSGQARGYVMSQIAGRSRTK